MNAVLDRNENDENATAPNDNHDGKLDRGVLAYVTVHSKQPNTRTNGDAKINIATVDAQGLTRLMTELGISAERVPQVLLRFSTSAPPGGTNQPPPSGNNTNGSVLQFYVRSGLTAEEFHLIENDVTTSTNAMLEGLVNVNTATATVLACLPGLDAEKADALIATRSGTDTQHSIAWLKDALEAQVAEQVGPFITGRSYVHTADIAALGHHGRGYSRVKFIFDTTEGGAKIRQRLDLTHLGWALGLEVRRQIAEAQDTP
jgi:hypothetical protein